MNTRLANLKIAHAASKETQAALHALYMSNTSNSLMWEMFQAQVEKTSTLDAMLVQEIIFPTPVV